MRTSRPLTVLVLALVLAGAPGAAVSAPPDHTVPTAAITDVTSRTFFPVDDGYRDRTRVAYQVDDEVDPSLDVRVAVTDSGGATVLERQATETTPGDGSLPWDGRDTAGTLQPAGDYTVTVTATDASGNTSEPASTTVTLDRARLVTRTYRKETRATTSTVSRQVGRCSTLRRPAGRGWRGSLGYYANTTCNRSGRPSVVATVNGVLVPQALRDRRAGSFYKSVVVKTHGGAASGRARSKAVMQYWNRRKSEWFAVERMGSRLGTHAGRKVPSAPMIFPNDGNPYLLWSLFTANGHRYDVRGYTVVLRYQVLRDPAAARTPATPSGRLTVDRAPTVR